MNLRITESATSRIEEILLEENNTNAKLRIFVQGGGCSGMQYGFVLDDAQNEDDFVVSAGSTAVLVDSMSAQYIQDAEIDFIDDLTGTRFSIKNPNAQTTCGCGSSFSPY